MSAEWNVYWVKYPKNSELFEMFKQKQKILYDLDGGAHDEMRKRAMAIPIIDYKNYNPECDTTAENLASSEFMVLLHWFACELESELETVKIPYPWFFECMDPNSGLPLCTRIDLKRAVYLDSGCELKHQEGVTGYSPTSSSFSLAILSDWASGTQEAFQVAKHASAANCDYTIHLGDTYYTGRYEDCFKNFCGQGGGVQFPYGKKGALAIAGNHEAYAHMVGFRDIIMPFCGLLTSNEEDGSVLRTTQRSPFWSLETDTWLILGLDTAYECVSIREWSLENNQEASNSRARFTNELIRWLQIHFSNTKKGIILLTHHPSFTLFDNVPVMENFANQLADIFTNKTVLWFFGHEHLLIWYRLQTWKNPDTQTSFHFFGRCIGNGGFPCKNQGEYQDQLKTAFKKYKPYIHLIEFGSGVHNNGHECTYPYGRNGYIKLKFRDNRVKVIYYVLEQEQMSQYRIKEFASEEFKFDGTQIIQCATHLKENPGTTFILNEQCNLHPNKAHSALQRSMNNTVSCCGRLG